MMTLTTTPADQLRGIPTKWIWAAAFFIVALFSGVFTPWDAIRYVLANQVWARREPSYSASLLATRCH
jgi:hypothetical protein